MSENKKDYQESVDTLITFGEEGLTARKDDPRTQEFVKNKEKELAEKSLFEGINLPMVKEKKMNPMKNTNIDKKSTKPFSKCIKLMGMKNVGKCILMDSSQL